MGCTFLNRVHSGHDQKLLLNLFESVRASAVVERSGLNTVVSVAVVTVLPSNGQVLAMPVEANGKTSSSGTAAILSLSSSMSVSSSVGG